jgi:hypothetical protein
MRLVLLVLLVVGSTARADDILYVQVPAVLDPSAPIAEAVERECDVERAIGNHVYSGVKRRYPAAQIAERRGEGTELRLTILAVQGVGPGPWSGSKSISVRADLTRQGNVVASNVFHREVGGSGFGRIRTACSVFDRVAVVLGRDVGAWIPSAMAALPDAPAAPAASTSPAVSASFAKGRTDLELKAAERLNNLEQLRQDGMITREEYDRKRAEILKDL